MIKKAGILAFVVTLLLVLLSPGLAQAQGEITISNNSAETEFPANLNFKLSAKSDATITNVRLHYTVDHESYAPVTSEVYLEFVPDTTIDVNWDWDMRKTGGLPPGTGIEYWWTVEDVNGDKVETNPIRATFDDNRYPWQSLTEDKVTLYWYEGGASFADEIMTAAQQALVRLSKDTGAYLKNPVKLYIYKNTLDLQGAMIFPQEWTGGVTYTGYGIIAIGISPDNLDWGKRAITHELTHLVIHQMTSNAYNDMPTWLNEGLAMYNEGSLESSYADLLKQTITQNNLISVRTLSSEFSTDPIKAYLSYAESYSLVDFLIATYGPDKMLGLLTTFSQGNGYYDGSLEAVYGFDMDGLNNLWKNYVAMPDQPVQPVETKKVQPALAVTLAVVAMALLLISGLALKNWARKRR